MPELPEVETIRRGLDQHARGCLIRRILLGRHRGFKFRESDFKRAVEGQIIQQLGRRGKYLIFELERHYCIFHLGMTGQLTLQDSKRKQEPFVPYLMTGHQKTMRDAVDKHTHLQFVLDSGDQILFRDVRRFGKVQLLLREEGALDAFFSRLGLEPFTSDYSLENFLALMKGRKVKSKTLLLDQRFVAGVGNIYADEALFESGIHPLRRTNQLRVYERKALFEAIPLVLKKGIRFGGTSIRDFINSDGTAGNHQKKLNVYGRGGKPCRDCGTILHKIVVGQRGTHFCPVCQPRKGSRRGR